MSYKNPLLTLVLSAMTGMALSASMAFAQSSTSFTYQGQLKDAGSAIDGAVDVRFTPYATQTGGSPLTTPATQANVPVANGLFATTVDFGAAPFTTNRAVWVQIEVASPAGSDQFRAINGRQRLSPTPFSLATRGINVDANGRVGIGVSDLLANLQVAGTIRADQFIVHGATANPFQIQRGDGSYIFRVFDFGEVRSTELTAELDGRGTNRPQLRFASANPGWVDIGQDASGAFVVEQRDTPVLSVTPNQRVGIGTSSPASLLDVGGRVRIDAAGNAGDSGYLLSLRSDNVNVAAIMSSLGNGYQYGLVNNASTAIIGAMDCDWGTNRSRLQCSIKNFVEPNPRDPSTDIYYACIEGPEAAMYERGTGTLVNGRAVITLPDHFADLASSQGITVIVTPLSADSMGLAVVGKGVGGFEVRELQRGSGTYAFDWEVKAVRKQYLDYQVVRPWTERKVVNTNVSDTQSWQMRQHEVAQSNARAEALEAAAAQAANR
ncbi:MAG: hypothetical protein WC718_02915 [Phycisphaerales bacterium]|jgi:hypothetical protein